MTELGSRSFRLFAALALLLASFVAFLPALDGDVLTYDDAPLLYGDGGQGGALERDPGSFFTGTFYEAYLPFYGLSYRLDGAFGAGRDAPFLLHFQSVLWHALASFLVFCVLGLLLRHRAGALLGALVFAVHPLHVESVAWIASRKDVLSGAFLFLAWLCALKAEDGWRAGTPLGIVFFLVACFAKASAIVLPALLLVAALLLPRYAGRRSRAALATWPWFLAAALPFAVHLLVGFERGVVRESRPLGESLLAWVAGWGGGLQRALVPIDLSLDYPEAHATSLGEVALPGALLVAALAVLVVARRRAPAVAFGVAAFLAALLPFNNVFPATETLAADRYLYLPLFGLAAVAAWAATRWRTAPTVGGLACAGLLVLSSVSSARFEDDETLWTATIEARDGSDLAWINRGLARVQRATSVDPHDLALLEDAADDLRRGLARARLKEQTARAALALALPLLELGEPAEAAERATQAIEIVADPKTSDARRFRAQALYHRGVVRKLGLGRLDLAAADFESSAQLWSRYEAWAEAGAAWLRCGQYGRAREALDRAAAFVPPRPEPVLDLAKLHRAHGNREAEMRALEEAARRDPRHPEVVQGWVEHWLDRESPDHVRARKELDRLPESSPVRRRLAAAVDVQTALYHFRRRDMEAALAAADRARESGVAGRAALQELGHVYLEAARYDDAVRCYRDARGGPGADRGLRNAIARAHALDAYAKLPVDEKAALAAMREALAADPDLLEAGAAPLRGEIAELRAATDPDVLLLAAAAVAGDAKEGERRAARLLDRTLPERERALVYRLRALVRAFAGLDFDAAEDDWHQVLARDEDDRWARYRLAQLWTMQATRRPPEERAALLERAIASLGALLEEEPEFLFARLQRGEARFALDDVSGAKLDYEELRRRGFDRKEVFLKEAVLHRLVFVKGGAATNLFEADRLLRQALARDPNYFDALFELGNVQHLLYDHGSDEERVVAFGEALKWYRRAMAVNPRRRAPRHEWARLCLKAADRAIARQRIPEAHELLERLERQASDIAEVHEKRVELALRPDFVKQTGIGPDEAFEAAEGALRRVEELAPGDPDLPALRSLFHRARGTSFYFTWMKAVTAKQEERAEAARRLAADEFRKACLAWPEDPENALVRKRLREIAPEVIEPDRQQAKQAYERGARAFEERRYAEAAAAFHEAVLLFPEATQFRFGWAMALLRDGRRDEARAELERVANAGDGAAHPEACYELGVYYLGRGETIDRRIARTWFERYVQTMEELDRADDPRVARAREFVAELARDS